MAEPQTTTLDSSVGRSKGWVEIRMPPSCNVNIKYNKPFYELGEVDKDNKYFFALARIWTNQGIVFRNRKGDTYDHNPIVLDIISEEPRTEEITHRNVVSVATELAKERWLGIIDDYSKSDKEERRKLLESRIYF